MRGDSLVRQWRILMLLAQSCEGHSALDIADKLGEPVRTIYRDLDTLQRAGFPFYTCRVGRQSRWKLMDGFRGMGTVPITMDELHVLEVARCLIGLLSHELGSVLGRVLDKLHLALPPKMSNELDTFRRHLQSSTDTLRRAVVLTPLRRWLTSVRSRRRRNVPHEPSA